VPSEAWCSYVHKISTIDTRPLLHLIGQHYNFKYSDWKWFASNYKLSIEDINPEGLNVGWYNKPMGEHLRKQSAVVGTSDLEYWSVVRQPIDAAEPMVVAAADEMPASEEMEQASDMEPSENLEGEDPLTNSIPSAVILGAGDADEDLVAEPQSEDDDADLAAEPESDVGNAAEIPIETGQE
jgi:hypothetical protein